MGGHVFVWVDCGKATRFVLIVVRCSLRTRLCGYWIAKHDEFHTLIGNLPESPFAKPRLAETY
jgi:hypothetical protein